MQGLLRFLRSSIGAKIGMGLSGAALFGFVVVHMLGNLQIFLGREALNNYAYKLKSLGGLLWVARAGLLGAVMLHIVSGIRLNTLNKAARKQHYAHKQWRRASFSSRTMVLSGLVVLSFIVYHLLHFTLGVTHPAHHALLDSAGRHDVYGMVTAGFKIPSVALSYIAANILLALHLSHGATSMFQSLGLMHPRYNGIIRKVGPVGSAIIAAGNVAMPLAIMTGVIG